MTRRVSTDGRFKMAFAFGVVAVVVALIFWLCRVLLCVFLGLLLAILLDSIAGLGIRYLKMRRGVAVVVATLLFLAGVAGAVTLISIPMARQATELVQSAPQKLAQFESWLRHQREQFPWIDRFLPNQESDKANAGKAPELAKKALISASAAMDVFATALGIFFLGVFLAMDPDRWMRGVAALWPRPNVEERVDLFRRIGDGLRSYLVSLGVYMVAMGAAWAIGLWLIGIKYPLLFGAIGGLVEVVPYLGPILGLLPPLALALTGGVHKVVWVLVLYVILHVLEGYVLVPFFMQHREHLPPPLVILSILLCSAVFGVLGLVLAVPLATAGYVLANETIYSRRRPTGAG